MWAPSLPTSPHLPPSLSASFDETNCHVGEALSLTVHKEQNPANNLRYLEGNLSPVGT